MLEKLANITNSSILLQYIINQDFSRKNALSYIKENCNQLQKTKNKLKTKKGGFEGDWGKVEITSRRTNLHINQGLQKDYQNRIKDTKKKIDSAIDKLKKKQEKLSISSITKESGVSRPTLYAHKDYIESKIPLKISKSNQSIELEKQIKELKNIIKKQKDENKALKQNNSDLIEVNYALTLELKNKGI